VSKTPLRLLCFLFCAALPARALDFGLALTQNLTSSTSTALFYRPVLNPWVSGPLGGRFSLSLSARVSFACSTEDATSSDKASPIPELDRAELTWLVSPDLSLTLGRQRFQDAAGLAASGPVDGLNGSFSVKGNRFSAGLYYTGLLYRGTADILMTSRDRRAYAQSPTLDDSYFASRRLLVSCDWENPGLSPRSSLALGFLSQLDLNEGEDRFHSQYLLARYRLKLPAGVEPDMALALGVGEGPDGLGVFFAGVLGGSWSLPGALDDRLSLRGLYSSPALGERLLAFVPLNALPQGQVFSPAIAGLALVKLAYTLRPRADLSLGLECSCFIRTDTVSFQDDREPDKLRGEGYMLGSEFYGTVQWTPLPDLALSVGGGAFVPRLGDAFEPEAGPRWKAALGLILSL
jgi:hypothetical protein